MLNATNSSLGSFIISALNTEGLPSNFRSIEGGDVCVSASKQPSEEGIRLIYEKALFSNKRLHVVDLREEPHFFAEGHAVTFYNGLNNDDNRGLSEAEINAKESAMLINLRLQETFEAYGERKKVKTGPAVFIDGVKQKNKNKELQLGNKISIATGDVKKEEDFVRTLKEAKYTRIHCTDHKIDEMTECSNEIIDLVKHACDLRNEWIHFHCHGGKGRASVALLTAYIFLNKENLEESIGHLISQDGFEWEREKYTHNKEVFDKIQKAAIPAGASRDRVLSASNPLIGECKVKREGGSGDSSMEFTENSTSTDILSNPDLGAYAPAGITAQKELS